MAILRPVMVTYLELSHTPLRRHDPCTHQAQRKSQILNANPYESGQTGQDLINEGPLGIGLDLAGCRLGFRLVWD